MFIRLEIGPRGLRAGGRLAAGHLGRNPDEEAWELFRDAALLHRQPLERVNES
jgi:hypothetical protein